jgi:integrase
MRRDEIRLLEWSDVDTKARTLTIPSSRSKTRKPRVGRLTTRALAALLALPRVPGSSFVFASPATKRPYSKTWVWDAWRRAADDAQLAPAGDDESVRLHDTRATTASRLFRLGASLPAVQTILGHASITSTEKYIRVQSRDVDAAHALLEGATRRGPQRAKANPPPAVPMSMAK